VPLLPLGFLVGDAGFEFGIRFSRTSRFHEFCPHVACLCLCDGAIREGTGSEIWNHFDSSAPSPRGGSVAPLCAGGFCCRGEIQSI
jgi:hypothetical protein